MTSESRHIGIEDWANILSDAATAEQMDWNGYPVKVRVSIGLREMTRLVESIMRGCVNAHTGVFYAEMLEFSIRSCVIQYYSDVVLPEDLELRYRAVFESGLYEDLIDVITKEQVESIRHALDIYVGAMMTHREMNASYPEVN